MHTDTTKPGAESHATPFQLVLACLSIYLLASLAAEVFWELTPETDRLLNLIDTGICFIFLADFAYRFTTAPSKLAYMKFGWIDLVASIPAVDFLRWGQAARVFRIFRVIRTIKSLKVLYEVFWASKRMSALAIMKLLVVAMVIFSSLAILHVEKKSEGSNIKTADDALWWSVVTLCTVGYGDRYPVTPEGRLIAAGLMLCGCVTFATLAGYTATGFVEDEKAKNNKVDTIEELAQEVRQLRDEIRAANQNKQT